MAERTSVTVNARFHVHKKTGMQRYAHEIASRLAPGIREIRPDRALKGPVGHLWEQCYLPSAVGRSLLWSPNNTGPVAVRHQVCTIHDIIPIDHPEWFNRSFSAWYKWLLPRLTRSVQHIIAISEFTRSRVIEAFGVKPENVSVVLNGIGPEFTPREEDEVERVRGILGIPAQPYLLYVGSLEPRKNLARLLRAWDAIQEKNPDIQLVLTGLKGGAGVFSNVQFDRIPPRVFFTGYVADEDLPALYSGALAFIYPSLYEGFGLPPAEAMACGTPVVTSVGTSLHEVTGDAAILVDPMSVESIASAITRVIDDETLRREMRVKGLARVQRFTWDGAAAQTWKILAREAGIS
ncbi:MAG: glycosyltransferase family 1 protein [Bryobacteraceae bacterium]